MQPCWVAEYLLPIQSRQRGDLLCALRWGLLVARLACRNARRRMLEKSLRLVRARVVVPVNLKALRPYGDDLLLDMLPVDRHKAEARVSSAKARRKRTRAHLNHVPPRCVQRMREGVVDVPCQDCVNMRRCTARQSMPAAAGIHRDAGVPWLPQGMMTDQDAPGVFTSTSQLPERCIQVFEIDDAIGPVQPALNTTRRVDRRDPDEAIAELDDPADAIKPVHMPSVEFEWRGKAPVQMKRQVQSWRVMIAGRDNAWDAETFHPGAGCTKFALSAVLRDVACNEDRVGPRLRDVLFERIERRRICCAKVNIRNVNEFHGVWLCRILRHWRLLTIAGLTLDPAFNLQDTVAVRHRLTRIKTFHPHLLGCE